jgi:glutathione S-transferase
MPTQQVSIYLEELKAAYGTDYTTQKIDINKNIQKEDWFIAVSSQRLEVTSLL